MNIGLGLGLSKNPLINDPSAIHGLVMWYDFTRMDSLRQDRDGTGAVTANNDPVEYVINLANGNENGDVLGFFARSPAAGSSYGGTFKTGGSGGQPYIQFDSDGTEQTKGFLSGFIGADATTDGGVASDKFSDVKFTSNNFTIIQVIKHDDSDIGTDNDTSLYLNGHETSNTLSSSRAVIRKEQASDKYSMLQAIVPSSGIDLESTISNNVLDTNPHVIMFRATSGANNMTMQVDGVVQTDTDTGFDKDILFNKATGISTTITGASFLSIGGSYSSGTMDDSWQGGIYETIMYDRYITDDELAGLEVYLGNKYGITIS